MVSLAPCSRLLGSFAFGLFASMGPCSSDARAADSTDTAYGRIDGDLAASLALGMSVGSRDPRAAADVRLRYVSTVGLFTTYEDAAPFGAAADPHRLLVTGLELRPLFLVKWLRGVETANPWVDLTLDSLGLELGSLFFLQSETRSHPGLQASLGFQVPVRPSASGPLVGFHFGGRWSEASLAGTGADNAADTSAFFLLTVGFQQVFGSPIVELGDRAPR